MHLLKKHHCDYFLYGLLLSSLLLNLTYAQGVYANIAIILAMVSAVLILIATASYYHVKHAAKVSATAHALLQEQKEEQALLNSETFKAIAIAQLHASDKGREFAEDAIQFAQKGQASAEVATLVAEKANKAKSEFLANMSHEIRTPMNAIIGLTNILLATTLDDNQKKCVSVLQTSADGLMLLINDLLDIDKIESEVIELEAAPFNMTVLLERVISVMSVRAKEKGINLTVKYEAGLYKTFIGDAARLRQILLNLVGNAVKFTDEGSVSIFLSNGGGGNGKKNINIAVTDTGIGIPENKIFDIFGKFIQADPSITRRYGGTGLGLAISKSLAEQMGGSITATSEVGVGSTFTLHLSLPVQESENAPLHHEEHIIYLDKQHNSTHLPILLVEDYEPNILVATIMLKNFGYRYEVVHNGQEAIDGFSPGKYSLILLDVQMPIMDGFETARHIRKFEQAANGSVRTPIIAMTAHALKGDREKCIGVGMDDYIPKPFNPHQLQAMLIKHLSRDITDNAA